MSFNLTPHVYMLVPFEHWDYVDEWRFDLIEYQGPEIQFYSFERPEIGTFDSISENSLQLAIQKTTLYFRQFRGFFFDAKVYVHLFDEEALLGQLQLVDLAIRFCMVLQKIGWDNSFNRTTDEATRRQAEADRLNTYVEAFKAGIIDRGTLNEVFEHGQYGDLPWDGSSPKI